MKLINLTPHPLHIHTRSGAIIELAPQAPAARCTQDTRVLFAMQLDYGVEVDVHSTVFGELENLPEPEAGARYILSYIAARAASESGRFNDILIPGPPVRDENGVVIGCQGLAVL